MNSSQSAIQPAEDMKVRNAEATKQKLLKAALAAFSTQGYEASSTRHIEAAAGVKRGLINYHFGSKRDLWEAAAEHMMAVTEQDLGAAMKNIAHVDATSRLRLFVRAYVVFCARHPELNRLMIQEGMHPDWRLEWLLERSVRLWYRRVCTVFEEAAALGVAPDMDAHHFYYSLTGAATLIFSNAAEAEALSGQNPLAATSVEAHADAVAKLFTSSGARI